MCAAPGPDQRSSRVLDLTDGGEGDTPEQGHCRACQQARAHRVDHSHATRIVLFAAATRLVDSRTLFKVCRRVIDDETVQRRSVSPVQKKSGLRGRSSYWEPSAHLPSWPCRQKRLTRERPDTFTQTASFVGARLQNQGGPYIF